MITTLVLATLAAPLPQSDIPTREQLAQRLATVQGQYSELARRVELLTNEVESVGMGGLTTVVGDGAHGLAPAASKIYYSQSPLSIGGYGEMLYENFQGGSKASQLDFLRAVLYLGYKFDDKWLVNSEIEIEHATISDSDTDTDGTDPDTDTSSGSVSVEFAYIEYLASENFTVRAGMLLVPMGFVNELHEPTTFYSANRPEIERRIIPSTWRENGVGVTGSTSDWAYRAYLINGFDASGFSDNGLRGGRQKGSQALAEDWALVARADYTGTEGLLAGVSAYYGASGQDAGVGSVSTTIVDLHAQYQLGALRLRGLYAMARLGDTAALNTEFGNDVGDEMSGFYLEAGYDVLKNSAQSLTPFVRYEEFDTQEGQLLGGAVDAAERDRDSWTFGLAWQPTAQVIFKADYVAEDNAADSGQDIFRLAIGYVF